MRKVILTTAAILAAAPAYAEHFVVGSNQFDTSINVSGGRVTYDSKVCYIDSAGNPECGSNGRFSANVADVYVKFVGDDAIYNNVYAVFLSCKVGANCFDDPGSVNLDVEHISFSSLAAAQQWKNQYFGGGGSPRAAANCQQDPAIGYGKQLANNVTTTTAGMVDGHFYTADGDIFVVHHIYQDANGMVAAAATYLESSDGTTYRLNPGHWKIKPGCYIHRAPASVLGYGKFTSSVFFKNKPPSKPVTWGNGQWSLTINPDDVTVRRGIDHATKMYTVLAQCKGDAACVHDNGSNKDLTNAQIHFTLLSQANRFFDALTKPGQ
jgi:hypothetical protein